jgi:hypothetical protein
MREVSDAFLLNMAEVSATLIGLFLVGIFFYVEGGIRRWEPARQVVEPYLRAGTRITLIVFSIPLALSLALVAVQLFWARILFVLLSLLLLVANVDTAVRVRGLAKVRGATAFVINEVITSLIAVMIVATPWILGGLRPTREDLTLAILLAFAAGFLSIGATVMSAFVDRSEIESAALARESREGRTDERSSR